MIKDVFKEENSEKEKEKAEKEKVKVEEDEDFSDQGKVKEREKEDPISLEKMKEMIGTMLKIGMKVLRLTSSHGLMIHTRTMKMCTHG